MRKITGTEKGKGKSRGWEGDRDEGIKSHLQRSRQNFCYLMQNETVPIPESITLINCTGNPQL